ncbi:MAG: hypothetical protein ABR878_01035 [Roseiarcus sp.]|jgi:hypothetical protein
MTGRRKSPAAPARAYRAESEEFRICTSSLENTQSLLTKQDDFHQGKDDFPFAYAQLLVTEHGVQNYIRTCPYCFNQHFHGGSALDSGDPREVYNKRAIFSHCYAGGGLYWLRPSGLPACFESRRAARNPNAKEGMARLARLGIPTSREILKRRSLAEQRRIRRMVFGNRTGS